MSRFVSHYGGLLRLWPWLSLAGGALLFVLAVGRLANVPARFSNVEMETALPLFVQVALAGGDRYLAANVGVFRAMTVSEANPPPAALQVQGKVQADAAWLNPAHEDNYYMAAAILSWGDQVSAANEVLGQAVAGRPFDFIPPFFLGFNHYYFLHDPLTAASYVKLAAERTDSAQNRQVFETTSARWTEQGSRPEEAIRILTAMQRATRLPGVKQYLGERIVSLNQLIDLRQASERYKTRYGRSPGDLADLIKVGLVRKLPPNPPGRAFVLDDAGIPQLINLRPPLRIRQ